MNLERRTLPLVTRLSRPVIQSFATSKSVVIKDWRLGVINRLLQLSVVVYICYYVISEGTHMEQEVPKGTIHAETNVTEGHREKSLRDQEERIVRESVPYCLPGDDGYRGSEYRYTHNGHKYENFKCVVMDGLAVPVAGESKLLVTTYFRLGKMFYVDVPADTHECPGPVEVNLDAHAVEVGRFFDVCLYNVVEQYFPIAAEEIKLNIVHSYYASALHKSGVLPETIIHGKDYDGPEIHCKPGEDIRVSISDLLAVAGVDLDKRLDEQNNTNGLSSIERGENTDVFPFARLSGVSLFLTFEYYTRALAPRRYKKSSGRKTDDVICVVEVRPEYLWSTQESDVRYRVIDQNDPFFIDVDRKRTSRAATSSLENIQLTYHRNGVRLIFQVGGSLGEFRLRHLISSLVEAAVLLGVAHSIVTLIALYGMGLSSQLYAEFIEESVDWRKEYARFAAQSLVAGTTFMRLDKNNSGTLNRTEIHTYLMEVMDGILDRPKVACMADFLMRQGEMEADVSVGRLDDRNGVKISTINKAEWVDIFTEEKVKIESLVRLVDSEYQNENIIQLLLDLAEGKYVRGFTANLGEGSTRLGVSIDEPSQEIPRLGSHLQEELLPNGSIMELEGGEDQA